jgi:hypothetical protein
MMTRVCRNSYETFRPEDWGRVHHSDSLPL